MVDTYIVDAVGTLINSSELSSQPSDRHFRGAWVIEGNVIQEDIEKARAIFKDKIREVRKPLLEAEDVTYMKALETDNADAKLASVLMKETLRNAPAAAAIDSASTITELKAAWDTATLGDNPYA